MQQLYQLSCHRTDSGCIFLHQGTNVPINSIDVTNVVYLTTSNVEVPAHSIVSVPTRKSVSVL